MAVSRAELMEVLLKDLLTLAKALIMQSGESGIAAVKDRQFVSRLFQEFVFSSFFKGLESQSQDDVI